MPARRMGGYMSISAPDAPLVERDTLQCVHCSAHYIVQPGSGKIRGFCRNCMGPTCGDPRCDNCIPFEKKVDLYEKGKIITL